MEEKVVRSSTRVLSSATEKGSGSRARWRFLVARWWDSTRSTRMADWQRRANGPWGSVTGAETVDWRALATSPSSW